MLPKYPDEKLMIDFKTIEYFRPGLIEKILKTCYKRLIDIFPDDKDRFYSQWKHEDNEVFNNPDTIGKYILLTCLNNNPIGYFSWDNRQYPVGVVGQNCILPDFQGQGYGRRQIEFIIKIFQDKGFNEVNAVTGDHEFFISAKKMYINCGFQERRKMQGNIFRLIEFARTI
jgi:GNAT superfamily N-acetyltransferase